MTALEHLDARIAEILAPVEAEIERLRDELQVALADFHGAEKQLCGADRALNEIRTICSLTHTGKPAAHAALSQIDQIARRGVGAMTYQSRVGDWMRQCFTSAICADRTERNHRLLEEALELVQSGGCTASDAHQLVDYVFGRPIGEMEQEVGGVMVCLAAFCNAHGVRLDESAEAELARVWTKIEQIRAKQAAKPKHSPLPA